MKSGKREMIEKGDKKTFEPYVGNRFQRFFVSAVRTGLEPATPCVTGMYSNQAELPHQVPFQGLQR